MKKINTGHYLMSCRLDNWVRLLRKADFRIDRERLPQLLAMLGTSLLTTPVAFLEKALYDKKIRESEMKQDPIFILGHWRSGTTYLQNILSRDPQFGWSDPLTTVIMPVRLLLGRVLRSAVEAGIGNGRPMDNVQYSMDSPMEETFASLSISEHCIINLITFPIASERFLSGAFIADLPEKERRKWRRDYSYILKKISYVHGGKQLILKSPDNTARVEELLSLYPDARFINIHRDPYKTIRSTINMFRIQTDVNRLSPLPDDLDELMEDTVIYIFGRMYRELFALQGSIAENRIVDIPYADFCKAPVEYLEKIYAKLEIPGFAAARPRFEAFAAQQKDYKKNSFDISPRLVRKINDNLGFYFEHYGYEMREVTE